MPGWTGVPTARRQARMMLGTEEDCADEGTATFVNAKVTLSRMSRASVMFRRFEVDDIAQEKQVRLAALQRAQLGKYPVIIMTRVS